MLLSAGVQREGKQLFLYFNEEVEFYFDLKSYVNFNRQSYKTDIPSHRYKLYRVDSRNKRKKSEQCVWLEWQVDGN